MAITEIKVSNFKSFRDLDVKLGPFSVLIGANASGKSNFVQLLKFFRHITTEGLGNAISMQGGKEYLVNVGLGAEQELALRLDWSLAEAPLLLLPLGEKIRFFAGQLAVEFGLKFGEKFRTHDITTDSVCLRGSLIEVQPGPDKQLGSGQIVLRRKDRKVEMEVLTRQGVLIEERNLSWPWIPPDLPLDALIFQYLPWFSFPDLRARWSFCDFDPKLPKKAVPPAGKKDLEEDGGNLAIVLKGIIEDADKKRKLGNLLRDVLPFVEDLRVEDVAGKSLLSVRETFSGKHDMPANLLSDGTISLIALIVALEFEESQVVVIEEPERNIHPALISKVVAMAKEASERKQVILTTQNPEVVREAGLESLLLVSRDKEGFSTIRRPAESQEVKAFLANDMGLNDLYVHNLLEF